MMKAKFAIMVILLAGTNYKEINAETGPVRLMGGSDANEGRVEVWRDNIWGRVCLRGWDGLDASVVCRQLGLEYTNAQVVAGNLFGQGRGPIWLDNIRCTGQENTLIDCPNDGWGTSISDCNLGTDAGVLCVNETHPVPAVRLASGSHPNQGRVEVLFNGIWGTICQDRWDNKDVTVICRQLGLPYANARAIGSAVFGQGNGKIWLKYVECEGTERNLGDCKHGGWGITGFPHGEECSHWEDVGVDCTDDELPRIPIRLIGGANNKEGQVELLYNGEWGAVCSHNLQETSATVMCKQLGFSSSHVIIIPNAADTYGITLGPIWLSWIHCTGLENSIQECSHAGWGADCAHSEGARTGLICEATPGQTPSVPGHNSPAWSRVEIIGIVFGCITAVGVIIALVTFVTRNRSTRR